MTRHSLLIILRFNRADEQDPLRCGVIESGKFKEMKGANASLVVGIVDPSMRSAMTPMMMIPLIGSTLKLYNKILKGVEELNSLYRGEGGYILNPASLNRTQSKLLLQSIRSLGNTIFDLLDSSEESAAVLNWLKGLFREYERLGGERNETHHVTLVTNDFSIPWYWLKSHDLFLCEVVALGMLQLSSFSAGYRGEANKSGREKVARERLYKALLVNGSPDLPFARAELDAVNAGLSATDGHADGELSRVTAEEVSTKTELKTLWVETELPEKIEQYRIVHFTGHYSSDALMIRDREITASQELDQFVDRSVLVLDGCSSSKGLKAWTDMDTVTAWLIRAGAVACVVTALPLKNDPILAEWFWTAFYQELRLRGTSIGQALRYARAVLKERLEEMDMPNAAWLFYQLVGSPTVDLFAESVEWTGPR